MFYSTFCHRGRAQLPAYTGLRVMMMPVVLGHMESVPPALADYAPTLRQLFSMGGHAGSVGYVTIDEQVLQPGQTMRRPGLHVDGLYNGRMGAWGGGGGWGSVGNGMLTVSSVPGCRAWQQSFEGMPGPDGECDHLADQLRGPGTLFGPSQVYWLDGLCVHQSVPPPADEEVRRQFVRLSLPSNGPWFEGYTANPLGVQPSGPVLPRRAYQRSPEVTL